MPRCSVFIATSLDGFIAREDGGIDWLDRVQLLGEDYGFAKFFASVDTLVMGRATYDTVRGFPEWPYGGKRVIVMTRRPAKAKHGELFVSGTPLEVQEVLEREGCEHVYIDGGVVIRQFLAWHLLDDVTISIIPVVLGSGIRLFDRDDSEHPLELVDSRSWPSSGLVQVRYRFNPDASAAGRARRTVGSHPPPAPSRIRRT